ncbi:hypothetical protein [Sediminibacterium ginsengisoli]|uniref:Uncharacterized protein n=1 Tax=Sediminibacterium ginsengisoli TaxID=413434 RepID=A0A1T4JQU6_9BACT|nr:hypothetical protein [Sediminibacterium ginsengisoli]SJZ32501.1 hypothetical protein SAMN04488132_10189 [Sediminibacterium ginsengisoli]
MDEFKKYLQQNAGSLDQDEPAPDLWNRISAELQPPVVKKTNVVMMVVRWSVAACIIVLAGIGTWHLVKGSKTAAPEAPTANIIKDTPPAKTDAPVEQPETVTTTEPEVLAKADVKPAAKKPKVQKQPTPKELSPDMQMLQNIENSFTQVINLQREKVSTMPMYAETPEYFNDFKIQIKQMEKDEKVIKSDIAKRGMNDELLDQLINLYQQKLNTLKQLQLEMNKLNSRYKKSRQPVDPTRTYFLNI